MRTLFSILLFIFLTTTPLLSQPVQDTTEQQLLDQLESSKKSYFFKNKNIWSSLIALSWHYQEQGNHDLGLKYATEALEIAEETKDSFIIGRSLSWVGWSLSEIGRYLAAKEIFERARALGISKNGSISLPMVWGLAQQELGYLHFKMGEIDEALKLLNETYTYAFQNQIDIGVTESGSRLAEIYLYQGNRSKALELASAALTAAIKCGCGQNNISRARILLTQVKLENGDENTSLKKELKDLIKVASPLYQATAKVLLSKFKDLAIEEKILLLTQAHNSLIAIDSDLQASTEAEIGKVLLETDLKDQSLTYLQNALSLNSDMLRKVDNSWILLSKSTAILQNDENLRNMILSSDAAFNYDSPKDAFNTLNKLFEVLEQKRYYRSIYNWSNRYLARFPAAPLEYTLYFKTQLNNEALKIISAHEDPAS